MGAPGGDPGRPDRGGQEGCSVRPVRPGDRGDRKDAGEEKDGTRTYIWSHADGCQGRMVESFQTDPDVKVFVAQIQTAGLGITLHAADTAIFYSLDYSFANYDQCRANPTG